MKIIYIDPTLYDLKVFILDMSRLHALLDETVGDPPRKVFVGLPNVSKKAFVGAGSLLTDFAWHYNAQILLTMHFASTRENLGLRLGDYNGVIRELHLYSKEFFDARPDSIQAHFDFLESVKNGGSFVES